MEKMEDMRDSRINRGDNDIWEEWGRKAVLLIVKEKEEGESRQSEEGWKVKRNESREKEE